MASGDAAKLLNQLYYSSNASPPVGVTKPAKKRRAVLGYAHEWQRQFGRFTRTISSSISDDVAVEFAGPREILTVAKTRVFRDAAAPAVPALT